MTDLNDSLKKLKEENQYWKRHEHFKEKQTFKSRLKKHLAPWYVFGYQLIRGLIWFWNNVLSYFFRFFRNIIEYILIGYRYVWGKFVYYKDEDGETQFSTPRAGIFVSLTFLSFFIWFAALNFVFDATLYFTTVSKDEKVYLTNQQEIIPGSDTHSVQGCHFLPCTDHNSVYFRVHASLFNELWSLLHGRGFFFADFVAAAVPIGISECTITSYGVRWKLFLRGTEIYPYLLKVSCIPVSVENKK